MKTSVTNQQLRSLLNDLGFDSKASEEPKCLSFEHHGSKAKVLLPSNKDDEPARSADVLSVKTHLLLRGHLDEAAFDMFLNHGVLKAS